MKSDVLSNFSWTFLSIVALIIFVVIFVIIIYWAFSSKNKNVYDEAKNLPLEEGKKDNHDDSSGDKK